MAAALCIAALANCTGSGRHSGAGTGYVVYGGANGRGEPMSLDSRGITRRYKVFGKSYAIVASADGFEQAGIASWYGPGFHGRTTANGEKYDMRRVSAAHKNLPFGTIVRVENLDNGRSIEVRINDRGPFHDGRVIDLSRKAADRIGLLGKGTARVRLSLKGSKKPVPVAKKRRGAIAANWDTGTAGTAPTPTPAPNPKPLSRQQVLETFGDSQTQEGTGKKWLQIGSYSEQRYADIIAEELRILGFTARAGIRVARPDGDSQHIRVMLGPFKAEAPARAMLDELRNSGYYDAFIVSQ